MIRNVLVSAGDAITARLVKQAGFNGIWISGFEASARLGLADNGSITMTEMLNIARPIVSAVDIPVWVDVDTGYGNFQRTVYEFESIGVAGVCIQDDLPHLKTNSLWGGDSPLMDMKEFGQKISIERSSIKIMARTEALIRGQGKQEAMARIKHYYSCGADFCLPHVRTIKDLIKVNDVPFPCAIVPTKFPTIKNRDLFNLGYQMVIWANQTERVKIKAVRECLNAMKTDDSAGYVDLKLSATLDEMKNLTPEY